MNIREIATRLAALCRQGKFTAARDELYSPEACSIEPEGSRNAGVIRGAAGLATKEKMFREMFEMHSCQVSEPLIAETFFSCAMTVDVTERKSGVRFPITELCVYEVRNGKIVREQFFYTPQS